MERRQFTREFAPIGTNALVRHALLDCQVCNRLGEMIIDMEYETPRIEASRIVESRSSGVSSPS